jgi:Uma2 family endonuclease
VPTGTLISVEEYLATAYRPDCDYVDGRVMERNLGRRDHSRLQTKLAGFLLNREPNWGIQVYVEQRVQVGPTRFRVPDVCVVLGRTDEQVLTKPPFICIEILSEEDRMSRMKERLDDYLAMGVPHVWLLDPATRQAYTVTAAAGLREVKEDVLKTTNPDFEIPLRELFE